MQRPIKFRAWVKYDEDEPGKMMVLDPCKVKLDYEDGYALVFGIDQDDFVYETRKANFPIMQYTGFKDKNGLDIYHKDFLSNGTNVFEVVWSNEFGGWAIVDRKTVKQRHHLLANSLKYQEVIGNIYDNPELSSANTN